VKKGTQWTAGDLDPKELRKRHDLQGPIDDAFMDSFLMVSPTGTASSAAIGAWCKAEEEHAIREWRRQLRGEARVKNDSEVTDADIAAHNLVLWGDAKSNSVLARIADQLPMKWSALPANGVLLMIYPNPLNPKKYIVLNSGHTFREVDNLNNARQVAKLPGLGGGGFGHDAGWIRSREDPRRGVFRGKMGGPEPEVVPRQ
jgi:hypothetical protein